VLNWIEIALLVAILGLQFKQNLRSLIPTRNRPKLIMDSSGLIDGRIVQIVKAGFTPEELVVPQFILRELQLLADSGDSQKRERARFGLDVVRDLSDGDYVSVTIDQTDFPTIKMTDDKLVALAKKLRAQLYTTDFNLGKVAILENIAVLNVNQLAQNLRPNSLPGELVTIKILQKGQGRDQGVGYLDDGTMVVVDNAASSIGKTVSATVERMHQTVAGKMVFASLKKT